MIAPLAFTLTLALATLAQGQARYVVLTDHGTIMVCDDEGKPVSIRTLTGDGTDEEAHTLLSIALGNILPDSPGSELLVLRSDNRIEVFPDPAAGSGDLHRLCVHPLSQHAKRLALKIDIADFLPDNPGLELIVLTRGPTDVEDKTTDDHYIHLHNTQGAEAGDTLRRVGRGSIFLDPPGRHEPYLAAAAGQVDKSSPTLEILAVTAQDEDGSRGWCEVFGVSSRLKPKRLYSSAFRASGSVKPVGVKTTATHVIVLNTPEDPRRDDRYRLDLFRIDALDMPRYDRTVRVGDEAAEPVKLLDFAVVGK